MVEKKRLIGKKCFLIVSSLVLFLTLISIVSAAPDVVVKFPITWGNYSTTMRVNITNTISNSSATSYNVTLYCNKTGGSVLARTGTDIVPVATIWNSTEIATNFSTTVNIGAYTETFGYYNCSAYADNGTATLGAGLTWSLAVKNISIDNTAPVVSFSAIVSTNDNALTNHNYTKSLVLILNASVLDGTIGMTTTGSVYFNVSNSTTTVNWTKATNVTSNFYNMTWVLSGVQDGIYNVTVWANDSLNNLQKLTYIQITVDGTAPTAAFICSPDSVTPSGSVDCTCTPTDAMAGVNYTEGALVFTIHPSVGTTGTFTKTCSFSDTAGNTGNATETYTVSAGDSGVATTTTSGTATTTKVNSWSTITPETAAVMTGFAASTGVEEIQIEVTGTASSVKVTVGGYTSTPAAVSVAKSDAYKYLQVTTQNLEDKLSKATMEIKVEKSWVSTNSLAKEDVSLFKYDETANTWNELTTTFKEEDTTYYYYTVELTSFSYFAIAPKGAAVSGGEEEVTGGEQPGTVAGLPSWVWIIIIVAILAVIGVIVFLKSKKK